MSYLVSTLPFFSIVSRACSRVCKWELTKRRWEETAWTLVSSQNGGVGRDFRFSPPFSCEFASVMRRGILVAESGGVARGGEEKRRKVWNLREGECSECWFELWVHFPSTQSSTRIDTCGVVRARLTLNLVTVAWFRNEKIENSQIPSICKLRVQCESGNGTPVSRNTPSTLYRHRK